MASPALAIAQRPPKYLKLHAGLQNIGTSQIGSARIPRGVTLHETHLEFRTSTGTPVSLVQMRTEVLYVKMSIGSKVICQLSATQLLALEAYMGEANQAGYLRIFHDLPHLESRAERDALAIGTTDTDEIFIEVTFGTVGGAGVGTASCNIRGLVSSEQRPLGAHCIFRESTRSFASTGEQEVADLERANMSKRGVSAYVFHMIQLPGSSTLTDIRVRVNGLDRFDRIKKEHMDALQTRAGRVLQASGTAPTTNGIWQVIDWAIDNTIDACFPLQGISEFSAYLTWATAAPNAYKIVHCQIDELGTDNA
jgi:Viral coat protein P2 N-terminal domain